MKRFISRLTRPSAMPREGWHSTSLSIVKSGRFVCLTDVRPIECTGNTGPHSLPPVGPDC